ncbi:hypothetical protein HMPREF9120_02839 [Neisseria sp. oral taxon 020 str. F0370]|nr:hypothetical protein HMPREF9120_02839 [Neisseria sp. oral taxon 020 str. F0370]
MVNGLRPSESRFSVFRRPRNKAAKNSTVISELHWNLTWKSYARRQPPPMRIFSTHSDLPAAGRVDIQLLQRILRHKTADARRKCSLCRP